MGKTQYYCAASLDGYIAELDDGLEWLTGYRGSYAADDAEPSPIGPDGAYESFYREVGALVSGSSTYEFVLGHLDGDAEWPYTGKPYWVLSSRDLPVREGEGVDIRVVEAEAAAVHAQMVEAAGGRNIWIVGGGDVASQFAGAGLLEEVLVTIVPVVLGEGKPLFSDRLPGGAMRLLGTTAFETGMVELRYGLGDRS